MPLFDTTKRKNTSDFRKVEHIDLTPGQSVIRIVDSAEDAVKFHVHYVKGVYVKCLGEDCPVCKNNLKLYTEYPDNYREIAGWSARQDRYAVNVLDRTSVKICPVCQKEIKKAGNSFPAVCPGCSRPIVDVAEAPLNKVKVLSKGVTLAEMLNGIDESILSPNGDKVGINNFDIVLYVTGTGREQKISVIPLSEKRDPVNIAKELKFDLNKIAVELSPEEIADLQRGVALRDIFAARQASATPEIKEDANTAEAVRNEVKKILNQQ